MLWQIQGTEAYVFGSLHLGHPSFYPLSNATEEAFSRAKQVWFEAPSDDSFRRRSVCSIMQAIQKVLKPKLLADTFAAGKRYGLTPKVIVAQRTWALASFLSNKSMEAEGFTPEFGLERYFEPRARAAGKTVSYLETSDDQFDVYDSASLTEQDEYLSYFLYSEDHARKQIWELVRVWKEADREGLERIVELSIRKFPFNERLLFDRNRKWMPKLKMVIDENRPTFICVGASHLAGKDSLGALFAKEFNRSLLPGNG